MLKQYMREQNRELWAVDRIHSRVEVPTCQVTGWYDRLIGTIDNFTGMVANGPTALRGQHRIMIGPWGHDSGAFVRRQGPLRLRPGGGHDLRRRGRAMVRLPVQGRRHRSRLRSRLRASGKAVSDEREQLAEHMTLDQAATLMGVSARHTRRILAAYRKEGAAALAHGNRGLRSTNATPEPLRSEVLRLAQTRYPDANHTHLSELLREREGIEIGRTTLRRPSPSPCPWGWSSRCRT